MYAPSTGRFLSRDTWGGSPNRPMSLNRWNYTNANPINFTDPSGRDPYGCDKDPNPAQCYKNWLENWRHRDQPFQNSTLIIACGMRTNGACAAGNPIYQDRNGNSHVPMYYVASQFAAGGGKVISMDYSTSGSTDKYSQDIWDKMNANPSVSIFLAGHSAGADAIVGAVALYQHSGGDLSRIRGVALLDSFLLTGNGSTVGHPMDWENQHDLGNQDNADAIIRAGVPMWTGHSTEDQIQDNFPSLSPGFGVPYLEDNHLQLAVDINALQVIVQFFAQNVPYLPCIG
jgi:hypothetical protein